MTCFLPSPETFRSSQSSWGNRGATSAHAEVARLQPLAIERRVWLHEWLQDQAVFTKPFVIQRLVSAILRSGNELKPRLASRCAIAWKAQTVSLEPTYETARFRDCVVGAAHAVSSPRSCPQRARSRA